MNRLIKLIDDYIYDYNYTVVCPPGIKMSKVRSVDVGYDPTDLVLNTKHAFVKTIVHDGFEFNTPTDGPLILINSKKIRSEQANVADESNRIRDQFRLPHCKGDTEKLTFNVNIGSILLLPEGLVERVSDGMINAMQADALSGYTTEIESSVSNVLISCYGEDHIGKIFL